MMRSMPGIVPVLFSLLLVSACAKVTTSISSTNSNDPLLPAQVESLNGTRWTLVAIQSMDDNVYQPRDGAQYTLEFLPQGRFAGQADCNRIQGSWTHSGKSQLVFNQIISTRALCPPGTLNELFPADLEFVRSFILREGHLYLATLADGAILEFAPLPVADAAPAFDCSEAEGSVETMVCEDDRLMSLACPICQRLTLCWQEYRVLDQGQ